ncbi:MAG: hypothetical protein IPK71_01590 [Myxococcales bacterium]|nr:hypothetical protein [Myxococcales bacterium]
MEATHRATSVNGGLAPVVEWAKAREKRGDIPQITARLWLTALDQFVEILDDDDPTEPKLFLDQLDRLTDRYCVKKLAKGETAKSYKSRVRSLLTNYFAWDADKTGWKYDARVLGQRPAKAQKGPKNDESSPSDPPCAAPAAAPAVGAQVLASASAATSTLRSFPLDAEETRLFEFRLPKGGISKDDAFRIAMHLVSFVHDGIVDPAFRGEMADVVRSAGR